MHPRSITQIKTAILAVASPPDHRQLTCPLHLFMPFLNKSPSGIKKVTQSRSYEHGDHSHFLGPVTKIQEVLTTLMGRKITLWFPLSSKQNIVHPLVMTADNWFKGIGGASDVLPQRNHSRIQAVLVVLVAWFWKYPTSNLLVARFPVRFNLTHKSQSISHFKIFFYNFVPTWCTSFKILFIWQGLQKAKCLGSAGTWCCHPKGLRSTVQRRSSALVGLYPALFPTVSEIRPKQQTLWDFFPAFNK